MDGGAVFPSGRYVGIFLYLDGRPGAIFCFLVSDNRRGDHILTCMSQIPMQAAGGRSGWRWEFSHASDRRLVRDVATWRRGDHYSAGFSLQRLVKLVDDFMIGLIAVWSKLINRHPCGHQ